MRHGSAGTIAPFDTSDACMGSDGQSGRYRASADRNAAAASARRSQTQHRTTMNFFTNIQEMQITRRSNHPFSAFVPMHRRLFPIEPCPREVARAAVREVLG
jgi:ureidoglycolate hydrolase